jgi:hypothetical protein
LLVYIFNKSDVAEVTFLSVLSHTEFQNPSVTGPSAAPTAALVVADEVKFRNMTSGFSSMADLGV